MDDMRRLGDIWGVKADREWPPKELAPGVVMRERPIKAASVLLRKATMRHSIIEPCVVDERAYYANLAAHNYREEDDGACVVCRGAKYVRYERPPGHTLFGQLVPCKVCFAAREPAAQTKREPRKGEPWWSK